MALLSPKFNSLGYQKKSKKQREDEKKKFEDAYREEQTRLKAMQPKFTAKYGAPKKKPLKVSKIPALSIPEGRGTREIQSHVLPGDVIQRRSPMDPRELAKESAEIREATIAKSNSIAPMYNKGPGQFLTPGIDITTIGARSRRP